MLDERAQPSAHAALPEGRRRRPHLCECKCPFVQHRTPALQSLAQIAKQQATRRALRRAAQPACSCKLLPGLDVLSSHQGDNRRPELFEHRLPHLALLEERVQYGALAALPEGRRRRPQLQEGGRALVQHREPAVQPLAHAAAQQVGGCALGDPKHAREGPQLVPCLEDVAIDERTPGTSESIQHFAPLFPIVNQRVQAFAQALGSKRRGTRAQLHLQCRSLVQHREPAVQPPAHAAAQQVGGCALGDPKHAREGPQLVPCLEDVAIDERTPGTSESIQHFAPLEPLGNERVQAFAQALGSKRHGTGAQLQQLVLLLDHHIHPRVISSMLCSVHE